ncbi:hypothetical protein DPMN_123361 [Dreissena polymorpha]|uniref:Uncharacterized protein n=1 Tax=Dreissena polymorpha TaxID=45954 RepID=A0A9D4GXA7_DREPO|nr:hypothetical protein DPMN_123361 [Dreissena polymorpha]
MNRKEPGRTGNDRCGTENNRDGTSYGNAPVNAKTCALPERHWHSPGLRRGITGDDRALPVPAGLWYTGALPAFTDAQPGHYRRQPGLCRDAAGFHRGTSGKLNYK